MRARILLLAIGAAMVPSAAFADEYVNGYQTKNGTYVAPYHRTTPDNTRSNNYGTQGNTNPYTGQAGTVNPNPPANTYGGTYNPYGNQRRY